MMSYYAAPGQQQQHSIVQQQQQQQQQPMMYAIPASGYVQHVQQPVVHYQQQQQQYPSAALGVAPRPISPVAATAVGVVAPRPISPVAATAPVVPSSTPSSLPAQAPPTATTTTYSPAQLNAIATLRQRIAADAAIYPPDVMAYCTEQCVARYIRAREWDIEAAYKMMRASLDWRSTYKPHLISESQIQGPLKIGTMFHSGFDRQNRPIIYVKPGAQSPNTIDERVMYVAWLMEHVTSIMGAGVEQVMIIMDFSEFGKRAKSPDSRQTAQSVINILQNHYPERLGAAVVINSPWYFNLLFKMMSPFINANTKKKMAWITGDHLQIFQILSQSVEPSQLLTIYGGNNGNYPAGEAHN